MARLNLSHLRTLLWLRWRLTRNQWRRAGALNAAIMFVLVFLGLVAAIVGSVVGLLGGMLALPYEPPRTTMFVFDALTVAFLFMWVIGLITELQRSELLDLSRFLHLPVALRDVFLLNYLASLLCFSMVTALPVMLGLSLGSALGRGPIMLLLIPLVLGFFFMITSWTYWLRGWLATLMINKRRRQAIIMGITFGIILLFQMPNLVMNVWLHPGRPQPNPSVEQQAEQAQHLVETHKRKEAIVKTVHLAVPLLWLSGSAGALAEGQVWPALGAALGMLGIGGWGFAQAYRGTIRYYQGTVTAKHLPQVAAVSAESNPDRKRTLVERRLSFLPEQASALGLAVLRALTRAPEVKMGLAANLVIFAVIGASAVFRNRGPIPDELRPFMACGAVAITFMGLTQLMFNHFGFDRNGFRAIALLPAPRRHILLGKNLALGVIAFGVFSFFLVLVTVFAHLHFLDVVAAVFEFAAAFLAMSILGNLSSILVPFRVAAGSMKATKPSGTTIIMAFGCHALSIPVMSLVALPPLTGMLVAWLCPLPPSLITLAAAIVLVSLALLVYWLTLGPLGHLLERRGPRILEMVTHETE